MYVVFGANGFLGRRVVARLAAEGLPVRAVSRRFDPDFAAEVDAEVDSGSIASVEVVEADLRDPFACLAALAGATRVLQLVSTSSPALRNDYAEQDVIENVLPQMRFARDCLAAGVGRLVFVSSGGAVYGPPRYLPIDEAHPTDPLNSHGLTKLMTEKYLGMLAQTRGLDAVVLRVANPFGPTQGFRKGQGLIPAILERQRRGLPVTVYGDGSARRDFVYVEDVVDAIRRALDLDAAKGGVFNVGSGRARSVNEVLAAVEARLGTPIAREHRPARETDVAVSELAIGRAREVLGWAPATPFEIAVDLTLAGQRPR
jgi:UDP-glucose 4-epimerase